jgi:hypothetical protein
VKPVTLKEILPFEQYEVLRPRFRPLFIAEKERRRLALGEHITLLFENGATVWYQVEEMLRTERISAEAAIRHEIDTYNELLPRPGELSATMLIEYSDAHERDAALSKLVGLERHLWIVIDGRRERVRFDERQMGENQVSSVQFVRFPLGGLDAAEFLKLAQADKVAVEIDHPNLSAQGAVTGPLAQALASDLAE